MWKQYYRVTSIDEALQILSAYGDKARIIAGATDLLLEMDRGARKGIDVLVDISNLQGFDRIILDEAGVIHIGPLVTHNACVGSKIIRDYAYPLSRACWEVGSPQIRNRGTVAGNLITGSPANDTISPLFALGAEISLRSVQGVRKVPISEFYTGVRKSIMRPDEILVEIEFPAMKENVRGTFIKFALRKAQAISLVNISAVLTFSQHEQSSALSDRTIEKAAITLGSVAPTIIHAREAEEYLVGNKLTDEIINNSAMLVVKSARPITDIRGSAGYRKAITRVMAKRTLTSIRDNKEKIGFPEAPVLLWGASGGKTPQINQSIRLETGETIKTTINGKSYELKNGCGKSLLRLLREDANLIGTKEGCAEGECGACTIYLDGIAVMSCMVPAERAYGADIVTIEGLSNGDQLHIIQQKFIEAGAVQCGYCTPGLLMSSAKLLEEKTFPSRDDIQQAITGNLCRCTGYYKIIEAIELAANTNKANN